MWKTELKFGISGGLALCAYKYIEFLPFFQTARLDSGVYTGLLAFVIIIAVIIWGVKSGRNADRDRPFTFLQAFRKGMIITIIMALLTCPFMYVYAKYINPAEAYTMIRYISANRGEDAPPLTHEDIQQTLDYYKPSNNALHTAEEIILTGFLISLFSAGMFRREHTTLTDNNKRSKIPSTLKKVFLLGAILTLFVLIVYISWILKYENITPWLYDFLVEPINPIILHAGTAAFSLISVIINVVYYNRITHYRRRHSVWNILMIIICGILFFILLLTLI